MSVSDGSIFSIQKYYYVNIRKQVLRDWQLLGKKLLDFEMSDHVTSTNSYSKCRFF